MIRLRRHSAERHLAERTVDRFERKINGPMKKEKT
jgi:hypothetical protein